MSGRAVEAAGDVDTLLLDKTGTITLGNRMATEFIPVDGANAETLADAAQLSSLGGTKLQRGDRLSRSPRKRTALCGRDVTEIGACLFPSALRPG